MSDRENGCQFSNSSGSSRRTSNDSIDDNIRKLVDSCEAEQNGPLNSQDLAETCKKFGLALEENVLMANGRCDHSNEDFNEQPSVNSPRSDEMNQNSSRDNFKEAERLDEKAESTAQNQTKEKWERDSGMDETNGDSTLQQIMAAASNAKGPSRSSNFLELASTNGFNSKKSLKLCWKKCLRHSYTNAFKTLVLLLVANWVSRV